MADTLTDDCPHCGQPYLKRHCAPGGGPCGWVVCKACKATVLRNLSRHYHPDDHHGQCVGPA